MMEKVDMATTNVTIDSTKKQETVYEWMKRNFREVSDKEVRVGDAVLVTTLVNITLFGIILGRANVNIHWSSRGKHGL